MEALCSFHWNCGRMGAVEGLFLADLDALKAADGKEVYFGEILGKHSEVHGTLEVDKDIDILTTDEVFLTQFKRILGGKFCTGYNPLHYIADVDEGDDE